MPRKGQRIKHRKPPSSKPAGGTPRNMADDPLGRTALVRYMELHFEWLLMTGSTNETVRGRRIALRRFIAWCMERGVTDPRDITKPIIDRYQRHLFYYRKPDGAPLTSGTQSGLLAPLKSYFKWLAQENHLLYNPASELQLPKQPKSLPKTILSIAEVEAILAEADPSTAPGLRDRALLETLYSTGLRRMEIPKLTLHDVDLVRRIVMVREGKGRRDRVIPIGARACAWIDKYLLEARPQLLAGHLRLVRQRLRRACGTRMGRLQGQALHGICGRQQARLHAPAAPCLRHPHARRRGRHSLHPGHARPRQPDHHRDLYARVDRQAARDPRRQPSGPIGAPPRPRIAKHDANPARRRTSPAGHARR